MTNLIKPTNELDEPIPNSSDPYYLAEIIDALREGDTTLLRLRQPILSSLELWIVFRQFQEWEGLDPCHRIDVCLAEENRCAARKEKWEREAAQWEREIDGHTIH